MDKELQQQIITLILKALLGDKEAISQLQQIMEAAKKGDPKAVLIAQLIQQTAKLLLGALMARFGAKLNYIRHLNGQCPMGYEIEYFKAGGRVGKRCKKCLKAQLGMEAPTNTLEAFKCGRKMKKKACGGPVKEAKCGTKVEMDKCGKKMKKKACGGPVKKDQKGEAIKPVKTVKTVITYPNQLEGQVRRVQYFNDGTQAVSNGGWGTDGMYLETLRGRQGEFGDTNGTPRQRLIADSLRRVDWGQFGRGPVKVPALRKKPLTK